jgi:5-methylcytosine-specific restriction endonuclease McrBC regulatory subunit McrC
MTKILLTTKDNSKLSLSDNEVAHIEDLRALAQPSISQLHNDEHHNLLIFPQDFDTWGDKIGEQHIFNLDNSNIVTGNIMGFVGYNNTKICINSRFTQDEGRDYFLHYMLQKVLAINLFDLKFDSDEESIFDFLIYLFPAYLKRAMRQGLYREYQTRKYNDADVRGRIDINRHIRSNIPFAGKVAYSTREYATDNHITQLIRHTIEYITTHRYGNNVLRQDEATVDAVSEVCEATPSYSSRDRRNVISQNLRSASHPYFVEYRPLQRLCLQILRHDDLRYGRDDQEIYGVLFDGAWLWEEYLNTFLCPILQHPRNKTKEGRLWLFKGNSGECYPDFYSKEHRIVLDAKYKGYDGWGNVQNADLYQVIAYMHISDALRGGFLVPTRKLQPPRRVLNGSGAEQMAILGMTVNREVSTFTEYSLQMELQEGMLVEHIKEFLQ